MAQKRNVSLEVAMALLAGCFIRNHAWTTTVTFGAQRYGLAPSCFLSSSDRSVDVPTLNEASAFVDCWKADTWSVNPTNDNRTNVLLQSFCSPAPQGYFVLQRAIVEGRIKGEPLADVLQKCSYLLKEGYQFAIRNAEEDSSWDVVPTSTTKCNVAPLRSIDRIRYPTALDLSHEAMNIVIDASEQHMPIDSAYTDELAQQALDRLFITLGTDIRGRAAADAAFAFCVAGVTNVELYEKLTLVACLELQRIGKRPSFRSKYVLHMVEKLAACGVNASDEPLRVLYRAAAECLEDKHEHLDVAQSLLQGQFSLFSDRPLLWLWRFSSKLQKLKPPEAVDRPSKRDCVQQFDNPKLDLVIDIGCGMGVSLLGLATLSREEEAQFRESPEGRALFPNVDWRKCNYLGGDLNQATLAYAQGLSRKWKIGGRVHFVYSSALGLLEKIRSESYLGRTALIMIQFPTPFRSASKVDDYGNSQLPSDPSKGFMVSLELLRKAAEQLKVSGGYLLLQSNCEDVAVTMREMAEESGLEAVSMSNPVTTPFDTDNSIRVPQRTVDWVGAGGERAVGAEWSKVPLIPSPGSTETEVMCRLDKTPIHRCLLKYKCS